jgi:hypothetical protein
MEDLLDLYTAPPDPQRPLVCLDERPITLTAARRPGQPLAPGRPRRDDYEYARCGGATIFAAFAPHAGWRTVQVRDRRTAQDFACFVRDLLQIHFPDAVTLRLVLDNLNTHTPGALYETFPPAEARQLARRIEWHFTPTHGSWLNMVELELSILARQCLDQHLPDRQIAQQHCTAWAAMRNQTQATVNWQFTTPVARTALQALYPTLGPPHALP